MGEEKGEFQKLKRGVLVGQEWIGHRTTYIVFPKAKKKGVF